MLGHTRNCTECGTPVFHGATLGLCPVCALRAATNLPGAAESFDFNETHPNSIRGDYELFEEIGRGGMGVVFRARQKSLNRIVALKVLSGGVFADPSGKRRLLSEAAAAARLQHPNIVAVHETGELDGHPFYSMDFIAGRTLAEVVQTGPVPPNRAAGWLRKISTAVDYAHTQGVLHRDLKPSNVLLDAADEPRITDFGLAKILDSPEAATLSGSIFGSPAYMPPEQAAGRVGEIGPAGDVYSLGALLYELLTGRPPFQGASPQAVLEQVKTSEPVALRRLNAGVPVDLETVTLKCLEKKPAQRYATAQELADELERFLDDRPVLARPVNAAEKIWRWSRRHPLVAALASSSVVLLIAFMTTLVVDSQRVRISRDEARQRLAGSLLTESRALRLAGEPGWREKSLRNLAEARRLDAGGAFTFQLRGEAIAALSRPALARRFVTNLPALNNVMTVCFDRVFERVAFWNVQTSAVQIRRVTDGKLLAQCRSSEPDEIHAFSSDGKFLSLRHGGAMSVWDAASGTNVISRAGSESHRKFNGGEFSPDGKKFGRGETSGQFVVYDLDAAPPTRDAQWPLPDGKTCGTVAWSADGKSLALVLGNNQLAVCEAASGRVRWRRSFDEMIWNVTWNNARGWLVLQSGDDRVLLLRPEDGSEIDHLNLAANGTPVARLSPDGHVLAASGERFGTQIFDATTRRKLAADPAPAWHLQFDASGTRIGSLLDGGQPVWLEWEPSLVQTTWHSPGQLDVGEHLIFSRDGRWLAALTGEGPVIWNFATGKIFAEAHLPRVRDVEFDSSGQRVFCVADDSLFAVELSENIGERTLLPKKVFSGGNFKSLALSDDGKIAVADFDRSVIHLIAGTNRAEFHVPAQPFDVAFSADGHWLACGSYLKNDIFVCDAQRSDLEPIRLVDAGVTALFSADGKKLFTFGHDARVWNVGDWKPLAALPLKSNGAESLIAAISRDGRWLAATQNDREVHVVELATGKIVAVLDGPGEGGILSLAFSPDGDTLVIGRDRGDLQLWPLPVLRLELGKIGLNW